MDFVLNKLTDLGLRRLYKFVLKRTIGKYLEDELLIDQLEVKSRDGVVRLRDIKFNSRVINEEFLELLPVKIVSISISELEVHLSYKTLLTDSCRFVVDKLDIVLAPNELYYKTKGSSSAKADAPVEVEPDPSQRPERVQPATEDVSTEEGQRSLSFIANWIEVVVARLQVQLGEVNITFRIPNVALDVEKVHKETHSHRRSKIPPGPARKPVPAVTHDIQLCLKNIHYFNDDPKAYSAADASSIALSTTLTTSNIYSSTATAVKLGARKIVKLEYIEVVLIECASPASTNYPPTVNNSTYVPSSRLRLIRLGSDLTAAVTLDHNQRSALRGVDVEVTVPNFAINIDIHSAKCLCLIISAYLASTAVDPVAKISAGATKVAAVDSAANALMAKSILQRVLQSDPTLRTLFWLEEQENRKKKAGSNKYQNVKAGGPGMNGEDNDIDFARVAQLMRQYRTTRTALGDPSPGADMSHSKSMTGGGGALSKSTLLNQSTVESDSDGDFPASVHSDGSGEDSDSDSGSVDSADFFDAVQRRPVTKVRLGESKRGTLNSSISNNMNRSNYTGASKGAESGLFQSTMSGMAPVSSKPDGMVNSINVYSSGYGGSIYTAAATQSLTLTAKLHVLSAELIFTDIKVPKLEDSDIDAHGSISTQDAKREELCVRLDEAVLRVSTVIVPPAPTASLFAAQASPPLRSNISISVSVGEVQLYEQYSEHTYALFKQHVSDSQSLPKLRQVIVSMHSAPDSRRIYASPHINVNVEYTLAADKNLHASVPTSPADRSMCASIDTTVALEPIVASTSVACIERWVQSFKDFPLISVDQEESSTVVSCNVHIAQLELFLHADSCAENYHVLTRTVPAVNTNADPDASDAYVSYWDTVLTAMNLSEHPDGWHALPNNTTASPYRGHLTHSRGGFRFLLSEICIKLATSSSKCMGSSVNSSGCSTTSNSSGGKRASGESILQAVEMAQVGLYAYVSLPSVSSGAYSTDISPRRFYNTLLVRASADDLGKYKVSISKNNPNESAQLPLPLRSSDDAHDDEFVVLNDHSQGSNNYTQDKTKHAGNKTSYTSGDAGPAAPYVSKSSLIYVSAYHIQVDIKQREYNVLMMVSDTIAPKAATASASTPTKAATTEHSPSSSKDGGFGFVLSSKLATICLSDNEPNIYNFPELDELLSSSRSNRNRGVKKDETFSICISIIEPAFEVMVAPKNIFISVKADDLGIYEMDLPQFRHLLRCGFDFNQTTGREARYGPNRHLVPFIRRASLHAMTGTSSTTANNIKSTTAPTDNAFTTLLGDNQDYGKAFEFRLLLTSTTTNAEASARTENSVNKHATVAAVVPTEVKSVHFFIDFYDIMLSYDPQSTWILSLANMLTPQTAAQILQHRREERARAAIDQFNLLSSAQREELGMTVGELLSNLSSDTAQCSSEPDPSATPAAPTIPSGSSATGAAKSDKNKRVPITLALPFELTKINVRVRDCIIDYCCAPTKSRTFLTIGLLTVTSTIASNSERFSLKFKVGGLSLYISDVLPLPTVQQVIAPVAGVEGDSSAMNNSIMRESQSGYKGGSRYKRGGVVFDASTKPDKGTSTAMNAAGVVHDEDIDAYLSTHSFVSLALVDHIDLLVTINNSEQEALVVQVNIGLCSLNACVDSLELFTDTMKEWGGEFQVACEKSEQVMQKAPKPYRDNSAAAVAARADSGTGVNGGVMDGTIDPVRFCDALPTGRHPADSSSAAAATARASAVQVLPAEMLEDIPLSVLLAAESEQGGVVSKNAVAASSGVFVQSVRTTQSDMDRLLVEDYYATADHANDQNGRNDQNDHDHNNSSNRHGDSAHTATSAASAVKYTTAGSNMDVAKVGIASPFPQTPLSVEEVPTVTFNPSHTISRSDSNNNSRMEPEFIAQYDYDDAYNHDTVQLVDPVVFSEQEGSGGFYTTEEAGEDEQVLDEDIVYSDEDGEEEGAFTRQGVDQHSPTRSATSADPDEDSVHSARSIALDDSTDDLDHIDVRRMQSSSMDSDNSGSNPHTPALVQSVFGLGNFTYFGLHTNSAAEKAPEEFELKDFKPNSNMLSAAEYTTLSVAGADSVNVIYNNEHSAAVANTVQTSSSPSDPPTSEGGAQWLQQELRASTDGAGALHLPGLVVASDHTKHPDTFDPCSDPEDGWAPQNHPTGNNHAGGGFLDDALPREEHAQYEADFGDYDYDLNETFSQPPVNTVDVQNTTRNSDEGWQSFPSNSDDFAEHVHALTLQPVNEFDEPTVAPQGRPAPNPSSSTDAVHVSKLTAAEQSVPFTTGPVATTGAAAAGLLDDLDRAWMQEQTDFVYDAAPVAQPAQTQTAGSTGTKDSKSHRKGSSAHQGLSQPSPAVVSAAASVPAKNPLQSIEAAQWYQDPDRLEVMPHYIPVVSRSEDLDDHRPAEEKSLHTKMLLKLKGTIKIRLFEGQDWAQKPTSNRSNGLGSKGVKGDSNPSYPADQPVNSDNKHAEPANNKNVRFNKEDLLKDLTAPAPHTTSTGRPPTSSRNTAAGPTTKSTGTVRSSRPLFEETITSKEEAKAAARKEAGAPTASSSTQPTPAPHTPRNQRDMLDSTFKDLFVCVRIYDNGSTGTVPAVYSLPSQRIVCSAHDFLISFGKVGMRRKKVLGSWISLNRPRDNLEPVLRLAFLAYENPPITTLDSAQRSPADALVMEHRLYVRILPLRCYLDEDLISFAKGLVPIKSAEEAEKGPSLKPAADPLLEASKSNEPYFQSVMITATEIKIDYRASSVDIHALHNGDYLQLLNIFPLDGLEITLRHVKLNGVQGAPAVLMKLLEHWVKDIYANQLHRVISGTAPFRGLSNIGNDLQELLAIPLRDYRKSGGTMKHLRRSTETLVRTVTRETLHATQQITMFVANAITELASDGPVPDPSSNAAGTINSTRRIADQRSATRNGGAANTSSTSNRSRNNGAMRQPAGVVEGLEKAYTSITREVSSAAETVIAIPIREYVHTGTGGYLKSVIRAFPIAVLRPVAGVMEGVSYTMLGLRNDLDPSARLDEEDIWNVDIGAFPTSPVYVNSSLKK